MRRFCRPSLAWSLAAAAAAIMVAWLRGWCGARADLRLFTPEELARYRGGPGDPGLYLAFLGRVYDVSSGRRHYEPGAHYSGFAGTSPVAHAGPPPAQSGSVVRSFIHSFIRCLPIPPFLPSLPSLSTTNQVARTQLYHPSGFWGGTTASRCSLYPHSMAVLDFMSKKRLSRWLLVPAYVPCARLAEPVRYNSCAQLQ
ncbi:PREDICTED: uncharacterized protein LOC106002053 [Dipodomys ordii]|uniref:Neuferricin n=1 Tax=Dipodomys ordii TaxID=10020 RepID=A0A1S3GWS3_DIPOR|nr:PREDICTED: uncharacterized protein LOC106002053 [Dipodomys ordii]